MHIILCHPADHDASDRGLYHLRCQASGKFIHVDDGIPYGSGPSGKKEGKIDGDDFPERFDDHGEVVADGGWA